MIKPEYVACDFGAESGRLILGSLENGELRLKELHRFENPQVKAIGHYHWDILHLFRELKIGMARAAAQGHTNLTGIGVDTWGVDFGLLDEDGELIENPVCYRDPRTEGIMEEVFKLVPRNEVYNITGIQFIQFNTIYQLFSLRNTARMKSARTMLHMPDLFNYMMTGKKVSEYTVASTSQLLDVSTRTWSRELLNKLGLPEGIMPPLVQPGSIVGTLLPDIMEETGLGPVPVIAPACHDTAAAVAAVPAEGEDWAYLSSGTWSLIGVELDNPCVNDFSRKSNFTNEGGVNNKIRFLKNNMGMWLLEECRRSWKKAGMEPGYEEIIKLASEAVPFRSVIDPDHISFLKPGDMPRAISEFCRKTGQQAPDSIGSQARCIFESLALKYRFLIEGINRIRGNKIKMLHIVGGGSRNEMLNQYTADSLGIPVIAGPVEATAIGNIIMQAIATGHLENLAEGRRMVRDSFPVKNFEPRDTVPWQEAFLRCSSFFS
jgi:rhamnulokinase